MTDTWHVLAHRKVSGTGQRDWEQIAWADDEGLAHGLFLQACASTTSHLRLVHDDGTAGARDPEGDHVTAERRGR